MAVHDSTTFALLVSESLATAVFDEAPAALPTFHQLFTKPYDSVRQQESFAEMGNLGYAEEKNKGANVNYYVIADGKKKTVTPPTFMIGVRYWRELVVDAARTGTFDFVVHGAMALRRAMWAQKELRPANLLNNLTSTSGRYGVPGYDSTTEALCENAHSVANGATQDNLLALAISESSAQDAVAMLRTQKDTQGVPAMTIPWRAWASTPKQQSRLQEIFQPIIMQRPVIATTDTIDGTTSTSDLVPVSSNVLARNYQVEVIWSPFFTGSHWGIMGPEHGLGILLNEALETNAMSDFDSTDFKMWIRERFESFTFKFRDLVGSTGY